MSETKTLEELKELVNSVSLPDLETLVESDEALSRQLSFTQPPDFLITKRDEGDCELWGKDPNNGWVCLKPE